MSFVSAAAAWGKGSARPSALPSSYANLVAKAAHKASSMMSDDPRAVTTVTTTTTTTKTTTATAAAAAAAAAVRKQFALREQQFLTEAELQQAMASHMLMRNPKQQQPSASAKSVIERLNVFDPEPVGSTTRWYAHVVQSFGDQIVVQAGPSKKDISPTISIRLNVVELLHRHFVTLNPVQHSVPTMVKRMGDEYVYPRETASREAERNYIVSKVTPLPKGIRIEPTKAEYAGIEFPKSMQELLQSICNFVLTMSVFRVVWYFHLNPTQEFSADVTSLNFEGKTPHFMARVFNDTNLTYSRPIGLLEAYVRSMHAVGLTFGKVGHEHPAELYPGKGTVRSILSSIFIVTHHRPADAPPLWQDKNAFTVNELFPFSEIRNRASDTDRRADHVTAPLNWLKSFHIGQNQAIIAEAGQQRPPSLHLYERQHIFRRDKVNMKSIGSNKKACKGVDPVCNFTLTGGEVPMQPSLVLHTARTTEISVRALLSAPAADDQKKKKKKKKKKKSAKRSNQAHSLQEMMKVPGYCPCSFGHRVEKRFHIAPLIMASIPSKAEMVQLSQEEQAARRNLEIGLSLFPQLNFPLLQPPICYNIAQKRYVFLTADIIDRAITNPTAYIASGALQGMLDGLPTATADKTTTEVRIAMSKAGQKLSEAKLVMIRRQHAAKQRLARDVRRPSKRKKTKPTVPLPEPKRIKFFQPPLAKDAPAHQPQLALGIGLLRQPTQAQPEQKAGDSLSEDHIFQEHRKKMKAMEDDHPILFSEANLMCGFDLTLDLADSASQMGQVERFMGDQTALQALPDISQFLLL